MKTKLFLFLTAITLIFQACSSDDDSINDPMIIACVTPINLSISEITDHTAVLNWLNPNDNLEVKVEYGLDGFIPGNGTVIMTSQNSTSITNFTSGTTYDFYVQAICAAGNTSAQSSVASFTTDVTECLTPINLSFSEITADSAILNWENPNDSQDVEVEYGLTGFSPGTGTVVSTSQNSTSITNLTSGTTYDFYVQVVCSANNASAQSSVASFTTDVTECLTPINLSFSEITADSAILNWESPNDSQDVEVEYGLTGFSPGTGTVVSTSQNATSITNLTSSTSYDFYVQAVCSANNMSPQSEVTSFSTTEISPFAGTWSGTYDGDDTGTWTFELSANGLFVSGINYSNNINDTFLTTSVTVTPDGYVTTINEFGGTSEGQITGDSIEGTWENTTDGISGTLIGSRE